MAPLDTEEQNSQDQASVDDRQSAPGASGEPSPKRATNAHPADGRPSAPLSEHAENFCARIVGNVDDPNTCAWFKKREDIDNDFLSILEQAASLETFKNIEGGFEFKVLFDDEDGKSRERTIQWHVLPPTRDKAEREFISGRNRGFCQQDAKAIVALAAVRGWKTINVHGSQKQKDMLWLEAMKLGLKVNDHTPGPEALKAWEEEQANGSSSGVTSADEAPSVTADNKGPATPPAAPSAPAGSNDASSASFSAARGDAGQAFNDAAAPRAAQQQSAAPATPSQPASRFVGVPINNSNPSKKPTSEQASARHREGEGRIPASAILAQQSRKQANGGRKGGAPTL